MWLSAWVFLVYTSRRLIRRKWIVTYQGQYFTIISSLSDCDRKCETWNAEPAIRTDGSSQTWPNPRVDGYGSGFGPPRVWGSGFCSVLEPNWPVYAVQTRTTGRITDLMQTLPADTWQFSVVKTTETRGRHMNSKWKPRHEYDIQAEWRWTMSLHLNYWIQHRMG